MNSHFPTIFFYFFSLSLFSSDNTSPSLYVLHLPSFLPSFLLSFLPSSLFSYATDSSLNNHLFFFLLLFHLILLLLLLFHFLMLALFPSFHSSSLILPPLPMNNHNDLFLYPLDSSISVPSITKKNKKGKIKINKNLYPSFPFFLSLTLRLSSIKS